MLLFDIRVKRNGIYSGDHNLRGGSENMGRLANCDVASSHPIIGSEISMSSLKIVNLSPLKSVT